MTNDKIEYELKGLYEHLHLDEDVYDYCSKIEKSLKERFEAIDQFTNLLYRERRTRQIPF